MLTRPCDSLPAEKHPLPAPPAAIDALRQACSATVPPSRARIISTGLTDLDSALPARGLTCAGIHEWFGLSDPDRVPRHSVAGSSWSPPFAILAFLATRALVTSPSAVLLWIGRAVWPYAPSLERPALDRSLFIHAPRPADRLWAADLALRSHVAAAVVLDASNFDLPATRRLQLAAESACMSNEVGGGGLCLLARPPHESTILSAATTRWSIRRVVSPHHARRWSVELLRCKGVRPTDHALAHARAWTLEHTHASRALAVVPDTLHGSRPSQVEAA